MSDDGVNPAPEPASSDAPAPEPSAAPTPAPAPAPAEPADAAPPPPAQPEAPVSARTEYIWGTGRRKKAVARVRIRPGTGKFLVNKREVQEYFKSERDQHAAHSPLDAAKLTTQYDIWVNVGGGGMTGQADAVKLGLARALAKAVPELAGPLREHGLMTRDARMKERKKYGLHGARRGMQWAKR